MYPAVRVSQLQALLAMRRKDRRLDHNAWQLWWEGFEVDRRRIRSFLNKVATEHWDLRGWAVDPKGNQLSKSAKRYVEKSGSVYLKDKTLRSARKKLSSGEFPNLVGALLNIAIGQYGMNSDEIVHQWAIETGLGMHHGRTDDISEMRPWTRNPPSLSQISRFVLEIPRKIDERLLPDPELDLARDELRRILAGIRDFLTLTQRAAGEGAFGLSGVRKLVERISTYQHAIAFLFWIVFRKNPLARVFLENVTQMHRQMEPVLLQQKAFDDLRKEVPGLSEALSPERAGAAMCNQRTMKRYQNELARLYKKYEKELTVFWEKHPEYKNLAFV
jgi:hypothetical protein